MKKLLLGLSLFLGFSTVTEAYDVCNPVVHYTFNNEDDLAEDGLSYISDNNGQTYYVNNEGGKALFTMAGVHHNLVLQQGSLANPDPLNLPSGHSARTMSFWFKFGNVYNTDTKNIIKWGSEANSQLFSLYATHTNPTDPYSRMRLNFSTHGNGFVASYDYYDLLEINKWYHIAVVYEPYQVKIYINGKYIGGQSNYDMNTASVNEVTIGNSNIDAFYDDLRIYDRALNFQEIDFLQQNFETEDCADTYEIDDCTGLLAKFFFEDEKSEEKPYIKVERYEGDDDLEFSTDGIKTEKDNALLIKFYNNDNGELVPLNLPLGNEKRTIIYTARYQETSNAGAFFLYGDQSVYNGSWMAGVNSFPQGHLLFADGGGGDGDNGLGHVLDSDFILGEEHHYAFVYDGEVLTVYLDGKFAFDFEHEFETTETNELVIGIYDGYMSSLRVYDKSFREAEIDFLYNNYLADTCEDEEWEEEDENEDDDNDVAVNELDQATLIVYPNPATDVLYVNGLEKTMNYNIVDLSGRVLMQGNVNAQEASINLENLANGYYIINFENGKNHKLVIQK